ncbi:hypothetical protein [Actinoallomurus iriomotensis]|uniref:Uncharacterized protein n=1 Tax=Actinoallomurus iriomotensis TaxID=478107 RepID=A0A9W6S9U3_9ACTN|nr:hypothetical protein [Actinoallomurus iriomotensis]GLY89684.1 hypothetical protein Airi02_076130 [Actinoallomurus iriomotensis]
MVSAHNPVSLLQHAGPDMYRKNAFRITGLGMGATAREIRRQAEKLRVAARLGTRSEAVILPLGEPPDDTATQQATQRLRDPVCRLLDELFWFWPARDGEEDGGLDALRRSDLDAASQSWEDAGTTVAVHNLAVLNHAQALDHDRFDACGRKLWKEAFAYWRRVVSDDTFWKLLESRVREMADPRLTPGTAEQLRAELPAALLSVNARLAVRTAKDDRSDDAAEHVALMRSSGFRAATVDEVLRDAIAPDAARIRALGEKAQQAVRADPRHGAEVTWRFLGQATPLLDLLESLLPEHHPVLLGARDEVAGRVLPCIVPYVEETDEWQTAGELLERALAIAATGAVRDRLEDNLETVRGNLLYGTCWFCRENPAHDQSACELKMYGEVRRTYGRIRWKSLTIEVPCCAMCKNGRSRRNVAIGCAPAILIVLLAVTFLGADTLIGAAIIGIMVAVLVMRGTTRYTSRRAAREFPPIREKLAEGWMFGEKPPGAN